MTFLGTLIHPTANRVASETSDKPVNAPAYGPTFMFRQPVAHETRIKPDQQHITYNRATLNEQAPRQTLPLRNSLFQPLERGPIRYVYTREWYWRHPTAQSDEIMPNGHVLVADGTLTQLPGASSMVPRSRLTFNLSTPAWSIPSNIQQAEGAI